MKTLNVAHKAMLTLSAGRLGWNTLGMTVLKVTTIGRKSGTPHTVMLTSPMKVGDAHVVIASRGGDDRHPAWYLNMLANPEVTVEMKDVTTTMVAGTASAEEKAKLWPQIVAAYRGYGRYQRRTERDIPVVFLKEKR